MMIEIDDDCLDGIIQGVIVENYVNLTGTLKAAKKQPSMLHPDDKVAYENVVAALEVLGSWYFPFGEFDKAVKKARKAK